MSTFSSKGGLYERAQKRFHLSEGKKLFTYPFFERQKLDAQVWLQLVSCNDGLFVLKQH